MTHENADTPEVTQKLDEMLDGFVYRKIWESLSGKEREILASMDEQEMKVEEVRTKVNMTSATFSQYRGKMISKGILTSPRYGYVQIALPRFSVIAKSYLQEM